MILVRSVLFFLGSGFTMIWVGLERVAYGKTTFVRWRFIIVSVIALYRFVASGLMGWSYSVPFWPIDLPSLPMSVFHFDIWLFLVVVALGLMLYSYLGLPPGGSANVSATVNYRKLSLFWGAWWGLIVLLFSNPSF